MEQLAVGGRLVVPVGGKFTQELYRVTRLSEDPGDVETETLGGCRFVNLVGEHGWRL